MTKRILTQSRLKELLHYCPDTGVFTWATSPNRSIKVGTVAGWIDRCNYIRLVINRKTYSAHRLAFLWMNGEFPKHQTDHINHIRNDNRWINLRDVTRSENQRNATFRINNTSGVTGVCWHKQHQKWVAQIRVNTEYKHIGYFIEKWNAICARKSAEYKYNFHPNHGNRKAL